MDNTADNRLYESEFALDCRFDINPASVIKTQYVVLSTPRSGSTLLCSALHNSRLAGVPFEYFHYSLLDKIGNPERFPYKLDPYFAKLQSKRTTPNGVFGMKLHFLQYDRLFGTDLRGIEFLLNFDKFILTYRRDKVLQAISMLLAIESNVWSRNAIDSTDTIGRQLKTTDIDVISKYVNDMTAQETSWREICSHAGVTPLEVAYEDLESRQTIEFDNVCNYLAIPNLYSNMLETATVKTTNVELTTVMKQAYINRIK